MGTTSLALDRTDVHNKGGRICRLSGTTEPNTHVKGLSIVKQYCTSKSAGAQNISKADGVTGNHVSIADISINKTLILNN